MSIAPRERRAVMIGAALVVAVVGYMYVLRPLMNRIGESDPAAEKQSLEFKTARARIAQYNNVVKQLDGMKKDLKVEPSEAPPSEQLQKLVEKFEQTAGRTNVKINNIQQLKSRARTTATQGSPKTDLQLNVTCENDAALVRFIDALENETLPIICDQINITATGGRGGEGGGGGGSSGGGGGESRGPRGRGGPQKRQIQADLKIHTYLFPEKATQ